MNAADNRPSIAIVYHSNYGHTKHVAERVAQGANERVATIVIDVATLKAPDAPEWQVLDEALMIVFASAVYMGSATAAFKDFMEQTSRRWFNRSWQGKLAAGIANSGGLSGDKLGVLQQMCLFAMQHGMHWVGMPLLPTGRGEQDLNRLSGFLGLMVQSDDASIQETPCQGDLDSAQWFGGHLALTVLDYWQGVQRRKDTENLCERDCR